VAPFLSYNFITVSPPHTVAYGFAQFCKYSKITLHKTSLRVSNDLEMAKELPAVKPPISAMEPSSATVVSTTAEKAVTIPRKWNTKNLGLRLGVDAISAASAAASAAPIITVIDRQVNP
jgi:hypothetical protein